MTCHRIGGTLPDGRTWSGFACTRGERRQLCSSCKSRPATKLCDFPLSGKHAGKTCDRPLCSSCACQAGLPNVDYCPAHARAGGGAT